MCNSCEYNCDCECCMGLAPPWMCSECNEYGFDVVPGGTWVF